VSTASAAIVTIDPFDQPVPPNAQNVCVSTSTSTPRVPGTTSGASGLNTIFGARWMQIVQTSPSPSDADAADVDQGHANALTFNNAAGSSSNLLVRWDGLTNGALPLNTAPTSDLTSAGTNAYSILQVLFDDQTFPGFPNYSVTVYTDSTHYSTLGEDFVQVRSGFPYFQPPADVLFPFGAFVQGVGAVGAATFTQIRAIDLNITGYPALDLQLDFLEAGPSPEPGTWVMMGTGLLGFAALVRRRRRQV
jgi:hypothetical protein